MTSLILACPSCRAKVRIPSDRGQLKITCPKCSANWLYPPIVTYLDVRFRCAKDDGHFKITMKRTNSDELFGVHRISRTDSIGRSLKPVTGTVVANAGQNSVNDRKSYHDYGANEFSWQGFYCPCCGYADNSDHSFIRCGRCGELVCGSRVSKDVAGKLHFECYPSCGGHGPISGKIESFGGDGGVSRQTANTQKISGAKIAGEITSRAGDFLNKPRDS